MTVYAVEAYTSAGHKIDFMANENELSVIVSHLKRPKWLQNKAFGLKSTDGSGIVLNMRLVAVMLMKEVYESAEDEEH